MRQKVRIFSLFAFVLMTFSALSLSGQAPVGANFNGVVRDAEGISLPGATVVAEHVPSGTQYGTITRSDGRFNLRNVRVGGPYTLRVSFVGYRSAEEDGIYLELGQEYTIDFELVDEAVELGEVAVYAQRDALISSNRTGARSRVSREQLDAMPSISRSIQDYTRLSPQVSGNNIAGRSGRRNAIHIDGVTFDDRFGLGSDAIPTIGNPISLDAIEEFQVAIAPYDVRQGNFTGGAINAVTRSGTNRLDGSAYFFGRNQDFISGELMGEESPIDDFSEYQTGLRLGGPVVQDKLFFFVNAEIKRESSPLFNYEESQFRGSTADLDEIISIARDVYGYDPGGYDRLTQNTDDWKVFTKLDWNISNVHRLTYQQNLVNGYDDRGISRGFNAFSLANRQYRQRGNQSNFSLQLNSAWSENFISEAKVAYTRLRQEADYGDNPFPSVRVETPDGHNVDFGVERFRHANQLDQDYFEITANMTYFAGDHSITVGTNNYLNSFRNLFIQDALGEYTFSNVFDNDGNLVQSGIDRFRQGAPNRYRHSYSTDEDEYGRLPEANWGYNTFALYAQDEWSVNSNFKVKLGLRADLTVFTDDPPSNPTFAQDFPQYDTGNVPDPTLQLNPRLGFNWNNDETQIRGGLGLFSGGEPGVWLSNQYSNTGVDLARLDVRRTFDPGFFTADVYNQPRPGGDNGLDPIETTEVNITDPDFKINQVFRANLAVEQRLPWDLVGTAEVLYTKNLHDINYQNLNVGDPNPNVRLTDGRPFYGEVNIDEDGNPVFSQARVSENFTNVILLTNTNKGDQYSLTGQLRKEFSNGWFADVSYTFSDGTSVNDGTSSRAISNWQYNEVPGDPNNAPAARSIHITRHRFLASASYRFDYGSTGNHATTISMIYEGRTGNPYHYIYYTPFFSGFSANGEYFGSNDLVYVPASPDEVNLVSDNWNELDAFISANPALDDYRGQITERGAGIQPWVHHMDLRVSHKIRTTGTQFLELTFDVMNFNNMLGNVFGQDWGIQRVAGYGTVSELTFLGYDATELPDGDIELKPRVSFDPDRVPTNDDQFNVSNLSSRWRAQIGIRYSF